MTILAVTTSMPALQSAAAAAAGPGAHPHARAGKRQEQLLPTGAGAASAGGGRGGAGGGGRTGVSKAALAEACQSIGAPRLASAKVLAHYDKSRNTERLVAQCAPYASCTSRQRALLRSTLACRASAVSSEQEQEEEEEGRMAG